MLKPRVTVLGFVGGLGLLTSLVAAREPRQAVTVGVRAGTRTIEFETREVTQADVTVSPDDQWLIFTILGHLFRLPVAGGSAEQLTFGPYYDSDPVFSPDGKQVAFVSDREDSDRNIFALELGTGKITPVTREPWADRPAWSPDGQAIAYLSLAGPPMIIFSLREYPVPALLRRVRLDGGAPETIGSTRRLFQSVFYLTDNRLAWTVIEFEPPGSGSDYFSATVSRDSRIEVLNPDGSTTTLRTLRGFADRVIAEPRGRGLFCRCYGATEEPVSQSLEHLLFVPLPVGPEQQVAPLSHSAAQGNGWYYHDPYRFAPASDGKSVYLGDAGRLWKLRVASGLREPVPFTAHVKLEIQSPTPPRKVTFASAGSTAPARIIQGPRLSSDGQRLVFGAAGYLWQQALDGGAATRLFSGHAFEVDPVFSPDGRELAFVRSDTGQDQVLVYNFATHQTRTIFSGDSYGLSWSPDGRRLVFVRDEGAKSPVVAVSVADGTSETLVDDASGSARPQFSADDQWLYFSPRRGTLFRMRPGKQAAAEPVVQLERGVRDPLVSPDGQWLAFRRNTGLWVTPRNTGPVTDASMRLLSPYGGYGFAFVTGGSTLIYATGNRVWRRSLAGGPESEIVLRLALQRPISPPLLIRRVRALNEVTGKFEPEQALYVEQGRIRWIGAERGHAIAPSALIVNAAGRFAIPGLFDMHVHVNGSIAEQEAFVAYGVTSIRDVGNSLPLLPILADRRDRGDNAAPRSFFSGNAFETGPLDDVGSRLLIRDAADVPGYVRSWKESGVSLLKIHPPIPWRLQRAVADEARRQGLPIAAHGMTVEEMVKGVTLGYATLEHAPIRVYDDIIQLLAAAGTWWDPTLELLGSEVFLREEPERLADPKARAFLPVWGTSQPGVFVAVNNSVLRGDWFDQLASIRSAHSRGVKLLAGTDKVFPWRVLAGLSLHWELEHLVEAGLTPLEVLRIATRDAAEAVGAQDNLGTLDAGKLADIVLLDRNPLENIKNTQTIWRVLEDGRLFDPEKLRPPVPVGKAK